MIKKLICALLLCIAQFNFCMDVQLTAPADGQVWTRINAQADVDPFADKIVAVRSDFVERFAEGDWSSNKLYTIDDPHIFYGKIETHHYDAIPNDYTLNIFKNDPNKSPIHIQLNNQARFFTENHQALFRLLTVAEMQCVLCPERSLCLTFDRERYCTLDNLTPIEQRRYVINKSGILTLLGLRAKRKTIMNNLPKDALRAHIIKPLIAQETARIAKKPLELWPKEKQSKKCVLQ